MNVSSKITGSEMREAYLLNLSPALALRLATANPRSFVVFPAAFLIYIVATFKAPLTAGKIGGVLVLLGFATFLLWMLLALHSSRVARKMNKSQSTYVFDARGITEHRMNGTQTFVPWTSIGKRWREGSTVITLGNPGNFLTLSKSALGAIQVNELRSLLRSQVSENLSVGSALAR